jgi:hypothetical protein
VNNNSLEEKSAMDPALKKYLGTGLAAALAAAGVGTTISRIASEKKRKKALDISKNRHVITVDVDIPNFLKDLPTPAQFAESAKPASSGNASLDVNADDIASLKKAILRNNGEKIDFFRKAASTAPKSDDVAKKDAGNVENKKNSDKPFNSTPTRLRGEDGKFMSATSTVTVNDVEKSAETILDRLGNKVIDPIVEFGNDTKEGLLESPKLVLGGITSVAVAAILAKYINKIRAESAKSKLDSQRDAYVEKLNGSEKIAQDESAGLGHTIGLGAGAAFLAPFALTTLIAYKVMKNRSEKQDKSKGSMGSFAIPPVVLYRTRGDVEKSAAYRSPAQRIEDAFKFVGDKISSGVGKLVDKTGLGVDAGVDRAIDIFGRKENQGRIADFAKNMMTGNGGAESFLKLLSAGDMVYAPVFASNSFKKKLLSNSKFQDMVIRMMKDKRYADSFGKVRDSAISREVGKLVGEGNEANQLLSGLVLSSGIWEPGVRQRMNSLASRYQ